MHYLFLRRQNGYRLLHDWLKGGLLETDRRHQDNSVEEGDQGQRSTQGKVNALTPSRRCTPDGADIVAANPVANRARTAEPVHPLFEVAARSPKTRKAFTRSHRADRRIPLREPNRQRRDLFGLSLARLPQDAFATRWRWGSIARRRRRSAQPMLHPSSTSGPISRFEDQDNFLMREETDPANQEVLLREEYDVPGPRRRRHRRAGQVR